MDFYDRAGAWITLYLKENELLNDMTRILSDYMDIDDVKFAAKLASQYVPQVVGIFVPEVAQVAEFIENNYELSELKDAFIDNTIEIISLIIEDPGPKEGSMELMLVDILSELLEDKPEVSLQEQARADAELEADIELEVAVAEEIIEMGEQGETQRQIEELKDEFKQEKKELVDKIDRMEDKYFENHPDLSEGQRTDAKGRFEAIKNEEVGILEARQDARVGELRAVQQERGEDSEKKRKEPEKPRTERS